MYNRICAVLLIWCLLPAVALAQPGDVRLSPPPVQELVLPDSARIQSAVTIGGRTLAAWGTSRRVSGDTIVHELHGALLHDSGGVVVRFGIGGENAFPSGYVRVLPLSSRFMVIWRDVRSAAPGLYAQRFTVDGAAIGGEELIDTGMISLSKQVPGVFGTPEKGYALFWNTMASQYFAPACYRRIAATGEFVGEAVHFGVNISLENSIKALPDMLLGTLGDGRGVIVHDDGQLEIGRFNGKAFFGERSGSEYRARRYHLSADTSLALLDGENVLLYRSLFDSTPSHTVPVPEVREGRFQSPVLARDTAGNYLLYYSVLSAWGEYSAVFRFYRIDISAQGERGAVSLIDSMPVESRGRKCQIDSGGKKESPYRMRCDGISYHTFHFTYWRPNPHYPYLDEFNRRVFMAAGRNGEFSLTYALPPEEICDRAKETFTNRLPGADSSRIIVRTAARETALSAPVGSRDRILPHHDPMIGLGEGGIMVGLRIPADSFTIFSLRTWEPSAGVPSGPVSSISLRSLMDLSPSGDRRYYFYRSEHVMVMAGDSLLVSSGAARSGGRIFPGGTELHQWAAWHSLYVAGSGGWRLALGNNQYTESMTGLSVPHRGFGAATDGSGIVMMIGYPHSSGNGTSQTFIRYDTAWNAAWSMPAGLALNGNGNIRLLLPLGERECVVVAGGAGMHLRDSVVVGRFDLDNPRDPASYHALSGGGFLRLRAADSSGYRFEITKYSLRGEVLKRDTLVFDERPAGFSIAQSPTDSVVAIVCGSDAGVRGTFLDLRTLRVLLADTLISATTGRVRAPSARFRGDSLVAVWEDYRSGESEIYGTTFPLPGWDTATASITRSSDPGVPGLRREKNITVTIRSMPVEGWAEVEYILPEPAAVDLSLYDMRGVPLHCCMEQSGIAGLNIFRVDLQNIPSCVYLLRLSTPGYLPVSRILAVHR